jgi:hypothetical protein
MKPHFRRYWDDRKARLTNGSAIATLDKGTLFFITTYQNRLVAVVDGFRYPINPKLLPELKRRSLPAHAQFTYEQKVQQFNKLGHTFVKYVDLQLSKFAGSLKVTSGFLNNQVYAYVEKSGVVYALVISKESLSARVYAQKKIVSKELNHYIERIAQRMRQKFDAELSPFTNLVSHVGNVKTPWNTVFSGTISSHSAKWFIR